MAKKIVQKQPPETAPAPPSVPATTAFLNGDSPLWALAPAVLALLVYAVSLQNGFVFFDDDKAILYNRAVLHPSISSFFSGENLGMFAPVTWIAYWIGNIISPKEAYGAHLIGLVFHALNASLVYIVLKNITHRHFAALFAAVLFAVHPIQAEAVCWAAALSTVLVSTG